MRDIYSAYPLRAHAYLMPFDTIRPGAWLLTGIDVAHNLRGQGVARDLMKQVLADADNEGAALYLSIQPDGTDRSLDFEQLEAWYIRLGFVIEISRGSMLREPAQQKGESSE